MKPEEVTGGIANYYATTCPKTGYGILAKVREGRPIKLEGMVMGAMSRMKELAGGGDDFAKHEAAVREEVTAFLAIATAVVARIGDSPPPFCK